MNSAKERAPRRAPRSSFSLNDDASEYLDVGQIEHIIKQYSNYVKWPVRLDGNSSIGRRRSKRPSEVKEEEYSDFTKSCVVAFQLTTFRLGNCICRSIRPIGSRRSCSFPRSLRLT